MKLLLVEDNPLVAQRIKRCLMDQHHVVDLVHTGEEALEQVATLIDYGLIILDLGLPKMPGDEVCKQLRQDGVKTPILILTATDDMASKIRLLDSGADDYITKPFDTIDLHARVTALTRRQPNNRQRIAASLPDIIIDTETRRVHREGQMIPLRPKEFDILKYLVDNTGRIVTREMITQHVWDTGNVRHNNSVDVHIKHLRDRIDRPFSTAIIKTEYGLGYRVDVPR